MSSDCSPKRSPECAKLLIILLIMIAPISGAQTENIVSIGNATLDPGANVTLPIKITNATGVAVVGIKLSYSPEMINVTDATAGSFVQKINDFFVMNNRNSTDGWVTINTYIIGEDLFNNVTIANITIKAIGSSGESPLNIAILAMADQNATPINGTTQNGSIKITPALTPASPSSSGGGGGGGGGGASSENYSNIELKEKYDLHILNDKVTRYAFTNRSNPILFVNITGNVSAGEINTAVEVLRGTSNLVNNKAPPGLVYKNVNIWVGTSGFAVSRNIKEAVIKFRVERQWLGQNNLENSNIKMVRWSGGAWIPLETKETDKDNEFVYFEARTFTFSPFAITGLKVTTEFPEIPQVQMTEKVTSTPVVTETKLPEKAPPVNLNIIIGVLLIIAAIAVLYTRIGR